MTEKLIMRGKIYWVNLPSINKEEKENIRELQGRHPVLVISNNQQNKSSPLITVLPLTSTIDKIYLQSKKGVILVDQIRTIDRKRLDNKIDEADENLIEKIEKALHITLALKN